MRNQLFNITQIFINNEWRSAGSGKTLDVVNPATEEVVTSVPAAAEADLDLDEAIARANDSPYGLAAAVWTKDIKKAHHVARKLQAGTVWVNSYNVYDTAVPFGGYKQSGFGREMSVHALEHYTQIKSVWVDLT